MTRTLKILTAIGATGRWVVLDHDPLSPDNEHLIDRLKLLENAQPTGNLAQYRPGVFSGIFIYMDGDPPSYGFEDMCRIEDLDDQSPTYALGGVCPDCLGVGKTNRIPDEGEPVADICILCMGKGELPDASNLRGLVIEYWRSQKLLSQYKEQLEGLLSRVENENRVHELLSLKAQGGVQ